MRTRQRRKDYNGNMALHRGTPDAEYSQVCAEKRNSMGELKRFFQEEDGAGVVEVVLVIVVIIGLVVIFQTKIKKIVNDIFTTITTKVKKVK